MDIVRSSLKARSAILLLKEIEQSEILLDFFGSKNQEAKESQKLKLEGIAKERKRRIDQLIANGARPIIWSVQVTEINSVNGVSFEIDWGNLLSDKTIKYIHFDVIPYNAVGDPAKCPDWKPFQIYRQGKGTN